MTQAPAVPDVVAPPPGNPRFPLVDGVRGLATISVLLFHAGLLAGALKGDGWHRWLAFMTFGPQMFFMFSGFLLYRPFLAARLQDRPRPTFSGYARNRALRVIPAYWVFLTVFAIYPGLPGDVFDQPWVYYGMIHIYFPDTVVGGLNVSWTLCTELTFYLALPLAVLAMDSVSRRFTPSRARTIEIATWLVIIALSWAYVRVVRSGEVTPSSFGWSLALPGMAAFFAMGMLLARLTIPLPGRPSVRDRIPSWLLFSAGSWALALAVYVWRMELRPGAATASLLNGVIGVLVLLPAIFAATGDRGPERILGNRVLKWLGVVSYGTYLAHYPIVHELHEAGVGDGTFAGFLTIAAATTAGSVALGALSYYALERPILRYKAGRRRTLTRASASG